VLNAAVNARQQVDGPGISRWYAKLYAGAAFLITLIFFDAFNLDKAPDMILFSYLISAFIASINYLYVDLFVSKYDQIVRRKDLDQQQAQKAKLSDDLQAQLKDLHQINQELQQQLSSAKKETYQAQQELEQQFTSAEKERHKLAQLVALAKEKKICLYCQEKVNGPKALAGHQANCSAYQSFRKINENGHATNTRK